MTDTIILPEDTKRVAQLREKHAGYVERVDYEGFPTENAWGYRQLDALYKATVLGMLLTDSGVAKDLVQRALRENDLPVNEPAFDFAFEVIAEYATAGDRYTGGGTGLRPILDDRSTLPITL